MRPTKLVLFDIDGTLTDTNVVDDVNIARAFREAYDIDIDVDWSRYRTSTDSGIAKEIVQGAFGRAMRPEELTGLSSRLAAMLAENSTDSPIQAMPGAAAAIAALEEAGYAVGLASGGWKSTAEAKLAAAGLELAHLPRAFADDHDQRQGIIETARDRAAILHDVGRFARIVYVGDAIWDLVTTRGMGIPFVGIASGPKADRLVSNGAHHVLPDYLDSAAFLDAIEASRPPSGV